MKDTHRVKETRPEPPGWLSRDETMDQVYARNWFVPLLFFCVWYVVVLLFKQIGRTIWIARWHWSRRRWLARFPAADRGRAVAEAPALEEAARSQPT